MRQEQVRRQINAAIDSIESALHDLGDRLDSLSVTGRQRNTVRRAGRSLRRTAGSLAERIPVERASAFAAGTGRTVRQHPVKTALTAAVAGYCIWSLIQYSTSRDGKGAGFRGKHVKPDAQDAFPRESATGEAQEYSHH